MDTITAKEISDITGKSIQAIHKIAIRDNWSFGEAPGRGRGGKIREFLISFLPEDMKIAIASHHQKQLIPMVPNPTSYTPVLLEQESRSLPSGARLNKGMAKADLLRLYVQALEKTGHGNKTQTRKEFIHAYNSGIAYPKIFDLVGKVSWKTIEGWKTKIKSTKETFDLCDRRGHCARGQCILSEQQTEILLKCALHPNKPLISEAIRMAWSIMHTKGIQNGNSAATYRRWLNDWASKNYHVWTSSREGGKAWNDKVAMYIERDYSLINVGDVIVADGHVLNFEILNPWTGKPKRMTMIVWLDMKSSYPLGWEIMPTENTQAISAALRRAIIALGKYPQVAYLDNGKAFKSRFFNNTDFDEAGFAGLYQRLGMKTIFAWPYHGQSKTVERFFGTFAELERWAPTYSGTSIETKPPRMMRGEKLHRRLYNKVVGDNCLTMEQAHRAIAAWFDQYAQRPQRGHLAGRAPVDLLLEEKGQGVDKAELTYLMMTRESRVIRQNGVHILGTNYNSPALYGRKHQVTVKYDLQDMSAIYVFDQHDEFICQATPVDKCHPAAYVLGTKEDQEKLEEHIKTKKHQEKEAGCLAREILESEVLPAHQRQMAEITQGQGKGQGAGGRDQGSGKVKRLPRLTDDAKKLEKEVAAILLQESKEKAEKEKDTQSRIAEGMQQYHESLGKTISIQDMNPDVKIEHETILDDSPEIWKVLPQMPENHRYEKLVEFEVRGWVIPKQWQAFMSYFEQTPGYMDRMDYYEEHRGRIVEMFQLEDKRLNEK